jgi:hypothetical protein
MQTAHPSQQLSDNEVDESAISMEELRGMLGKELKAKQLEKGLKGLLTHLQCDAQLVVKPSLFWSKALSELA